MVPGACFVRADGVSADASTGQAARPGRATDHSAGTRCLEGRQDEGRGLGRETVHGRSHVDSKRHDPCRRCRVQASDAYNAGRCRWPERSVTAATRSSRR